MNIKTVGVIGFGTMGSGIAQTCAEAGYAVIGVDTSEESRKKGMASINYWLQKSVAKGKLTVENKRNIISKINVSARIQDLKDCDLVIEAVFDNLDLKKRVFAELDTVCAAETILASNSSTLSIIDIAAATKRMEKVLGLHFFNPVALMKLVEVVKTIAVNEETIAIGKEFAVSLGKTPVIAPDVPGFIVNRINSPSTIAAINMLEQGLASREDIDTAMKLGGEPADWRIGTVRCNRPGCPPGGV